MMLQQRTNPNLNMKTKLPLVNIENLDITNKNCFSQIVTSKIDSLAIEKFYRKLSNIGYNVVHNEITNKVSM